jgi:DNA-binding MarR family transcriptional regulator
MELADFFPYRIAVLSELTSQCIATVYRERFGLSRDEWRVLAALADGDSHRMVDVAAHSTLEKMQVSRAAASMERAGLIEKLPDPQDGRGWRLKLKPAGRTLHARLVPMVRSREAFLLDALTPQEREVLDRALAKLGERAQQLLSQG